MCFGALNEVQEVRSVCFFIVMVKSFCAGGKQNTNWNFIPALNRNQPNNGSHIGTSMRNELDRLLDQSHSSPKSCFPQQRCCWHGSNLKLRWASEQFCIQLPLPHGTLTTACFHIPMQSWFEWLCGGDRDLLLHAEGDLGVLGHSPL